MSAEVASVLLELNLRYALALESGQLEQLAAYADLVMRWQRVTNLTAAANALAFTREHVADTLAALPYLRARSIVDVGSGNGVPGIVLAIAQPASRVVLLEPRARRARFLTQARIELGLANTEVIVARVEQWQVDTAYELVVTRAFAELARFVAATRALRQAGTRLVAMKGRLDPRELVACGLAPGDMSTIALDVPGFSHRHLVVIEAARSAARE